MNGSKCLTGSRSDLDCDDTGSSREKEWNTKTLFKRMAVSMATAGALTAGMVVVAASDAVAAPAPPTTGA